MADEQKTLPGEEQVIIEGADQKKLDEIVKKDAKTGRAMTGFWYYVTAGLGVFMVLFYMYNAGFLPVAAQWHRGTYVLITYVMVFLSYPFWRKSPQHRPSVADVILALVAVLAVGYWMVEFENLNYRMGSENELDTTFSIIGILISLEVSRRVLGNSMTVVGGLFLAYCFWGNYIEYIPFLDIFAHDGFPYTQAINHIYLKQEGVFGIMADVLVSYVILFIFFGSFLKYSGCFHFFLDLPMALAGRSVGGPAKVAIIASGFFGSVSGSAIANTVSTGAFTIPLMKKAGFKPHVAGAIEPSASIGGMFMPPIMGAGGFLMAEYTGIPYVEIMKMAAFPALIYFLSVYVMVHFEAKRWGIVVTPDPNAPKAWQILLTQWPRSIPLVIIIVLMLMGYSPGYAAFWATLSCVAVSWLDKDYRMGPKRILTAMVEGSRNTLIIGATVGVIGIIVGGIALTGIGLKFSDIIISLSQGILPVSILLIGLASLVLGMGVPVTAAYLITAVLCAGALQSMMSQAWFGMSFQDLQINRELIHHVPWLLIAPHMIVYWFSQDSNITPPVCVAAYAGAAIAGSDPWKTGWTAFKFAKMLYIGPFLFAYSPAFLLHGDLWRIGLTWITIILGTIAFGSLTMGYLLCPMKVLEWAVMAVATLLLFFPSVVHIVGADIPLYVIDFVAIALWVLIYFIQKARIKKDPTLTLPIEERMKLKQAKRVAA